MQAGYMPRHVMRHTRYRSRPPGAVQGRGMGPAHPGYGAPLGHTGYAHAMHAAGPLNPNLCLQQGSLGGLVMLLWLKAHPVSTAAIVMTADCKL